MTAFYTPLIGRFGNQCFQYAEARGLAESTNTPICTPPWVGEEIFDLPSVERSSDDMITVGGYGQNQDALRYTRAQVKQWFRFKPAIEKALSAIPLDPILAHRRVLLPDDLCQSVVPRQFIVLMVGSNTERCASVQPCHHR
ncbi:MAG: hypothetical protein AUG89_11520 [Acidobacteria bacterium 13_1_20CM_4_56_7]|nr:MAG: hypothetical protein AUG89_11520 [Acidobacteria bacterium 13_1_20CM_4_56_7]